MTTNIRAWGNSQGLYLPKTLLKEANMGINDRVEISVVEGGIMIRKDNRASEKALALESLRSIRNSHERIRSDISSDYRKEIEEYLDEKYGR